MTNETITLISLSGYLYLCGGFALTVMTRFNNKKMVFFLWPLVPMYVLFTLLLSNQQEVDAVIDEHEEGL